MKPEIGQEIVTSKSHIHGVIEQVEDHQYSEKYWSVKFVTDDGKERWTAVRKPDEPPQQ